MHKILIQTTTAFLIFASAIVQAASTPPPVANLSQFSNTKGAVPLATHFDGSLSSCDGLSNSCTDYKWNFGDGFTDSGSFQSNHTYTSAGKYTVTLTVTDKIGRTSKATAPVTVVPAESLTNYVAACQTQLNFKSSDIPDLDCYDSDIFEPSTTPDNPVQDPVNDHLGYRRVTDQVDLAFACRWLFGDKANRNASRSVELLIHNRQNGNTCFFSAQQQNVTLSDGSTKSGVPSKITSPTNCVSPSNCAASKFWDAPADVDATVRCVGCHVSGPYIATPLIAPYLAKYGLLNNGHDTLSNVNFSDLSTPNKNVKYHAISGTVNGAPGAFSLWDGLKQSYINYPGSINPSDSACAQGCHMIGTLSPQKDIAGSAQTTTLLHGPASILQEIYDANVMAPYEDGSNYRWINLAIPDAGTESETLATAMNAKSTLVPTLLGNCTKPGLAEAHVVGSDNVFLISQPSVYTLIPDRLSVFNAKDGLVCLNSDQEPGHPCQDYKIRYECTDPNNPNIKTWTNWYNIDSPSGDGDHEERYKDTNVCTSPAGLTVLGIQAAFTLSANGWTYSAFGPSDRLASVSQYGLTCNAADQPDGKCSNYVVRYDNCDVAQDMGNKTLTNVFAVGKQLTAATGSLVKGQAHNNSWNTQSWAIESVPNTEYVRLHNTGTNVYLNVSSQTDGTAVSTAALNISWTSEMWLIEPVANSTDIRLKNLWTGKYLTMADPKSFPSTPDYLPIYSQSRNTSWTSQRWVIQ